MILYGGLFCAWTIAHFYAGIVLYYTTLSITHSFTIHYAQLIMSCPLYNIDLVSIDTTYRWFTCNYDIFYVNEICFKLLFQILF